MTPEDYAQIGLKAGLEVHQQLLTRSKLFCRCPAGHYSDEYDAEILRHMRPTLSELGEYDGTALMEKKTKKNITYRINRHTVCTYEFDDTPPFFMDQESLEIALEIGLLLNLNMVSELHIARKQYLDGSIPTGFQRTTIVGVDGWIPCCGKKIRIRQLGLEEDACREVSDIGHERVYLTDRLGMPLIEVVTEPDMQTPQEAAEVGHMIRMLCRSTRKVRTGIGATRQDVNVSVKGGTRVEIKGTPQITRNPHLIYSEARRQCSLLHIRELLKERGVTSDTLQFEKNDVTRLVSRSIYAPLRTAVESGLKVKCVALKGFGGIFNVNTQENTTFAKEFSDRVRVIACLTLLPNNVHSDMASETLSGKDWREIRKRLRADHLDALILVWGNEEDTETACNEIVIRAKEATLGIPSDTRQAYKDGTNGFERVLPGPERMYPDTDLPPIAIAPERLKQIRTSLPRPVWDVRDELRAMHLSEDEIRMLLRTGRGQLFCNVVRELHIAPQTAAEVLCRRMKSFSRRGMNIRNLSDSEIREVLQHHSAGKITRAAAVRIVEHLLGQPAEQPDGKSRVQRAIYELHAGPMDDAELRALVREHLRQCESLVFNDADDQWRFVMGQIMNQVRFRVEGSIVSDALRRMAKVQPHPAAQGMQP